MIIISFRLPVAPTRILVDDPSPSLNLAPRCAAGGQAWWAGGCVAASKELWGAGVRSTIATQLYSIGQLVGRVGCAPGMA